MIYIARTKGATVITREWPGYVDQKNFAAERASHDWIFSLDADERVTPALAADPRALLAAGPAAPAYRIARVTFHLGRWLRTTDFYPDPRKPGCTTDARRAGVARDVHESVTADGPVGRLNEEIQHYSYRDLHDHLDRINHYTSLAARQMHEAGRRTWPLDLLVHPPAAFLRNFVLRRGFLDGGVGLTLSLVNAYAVFAKFASYGSFSDARRPRATEAPRATETRRHRTHQTTDPLCLCDSVAFDYVLAAHRHGQNLARRPSQVMHTVLGLRGLDHRAILVAHPEGELFRRMSEGTDLIPLASRNEVDSTPPGGSSAS